MAAKNCLDNLTVGDITYVETFAVGSSIREIARGSTLDEATGIGRRELKIKRLID